MQTTSLFRKLFFFSLQIYLTCTQTATNNNLDRAENSVCRDRLGNFRPKDFKLSTCSLCYFYLVVENPNFVLNREISVKQFQNEPFLLFQNGSDANGNIEIHPDFENRASVDIICDTLDDVTCNEWLSCCKVAWDCCQTQMHRKRPDDEENYCPQTFDGWDCWDFTLLNQTVTQACPEFLAPNKGATSSKTCGSDGNWKTNDNSELEFTEYEDCSRKDQKQVYRTPILVGMIVNIAGMMLLVPSIIIFLIYRPLRRQHRIKIHLNFFISILVASILGLIWDAVVRLDRLENKKEESFLHTQQIICKMLHVLHRFARASTFFWMSCEGFFLHRLLVNAFSPPKRFIGYIIYAWGVPLVLCCMYALIRKEIADDSLCWILPLKDNQVALDWVLIYTPSIVCITCGFSVPACILYNYHQANIVFLFNILKLLVQKSTKHPNEPNNFRRILKATFILVPLFGIHQFCLIYRPSPDTGDWYEAYEIISAIFINSQGIIVSLLFCYFNKEVQCSIKLSFKRLGRRYSQRRNSDGRKLSMSISSTSRRTSVSSVQNGVITTLYENGLTYNQPFNEKDIKGYGLGGKETGNKASVIELQVKMSDQQRQKDCSITATKSKKDTENEEYLSIETFTESVRL